MSTSAPMRKILSLGPWHPRRGHLFAVYHADQMFMQPGYYVWFLWRHFLVWPQRKVTMR